MYFSVLDSVFLYLKDKTDTLQNYVGTIKRLKEYTSDWHNIKNDIAKKINTLEKNLSEFIEKTGGSGAVKAGRVLRIGILRISPHLCGVPWSLY